MPLFRFAFYGSLRSEFPTLDELKIRSQLRFLDKVYLPGQLLHLGEFPGLIEGPGRVEAELHESDDEHVLHVLDAYEGYFPERPEESLFLRREVFLKDAGCHAWVYFLRVAPAHPIPIPDGIWSLDNAPAQPTVSTEND